MKDHLTTQETKRLRIRALSAKDVQPWKAFLSNPGAIKHILIEEEFNDELAENWINKQLKRYKDTGFGLMAIENKETGEFIGQCGLLAQEVDGVSEIEIGYHMLPNHWGKGYATEAATHFKEYAFANNICESVIAMILPENVGSQMVASRNGMNKEKAVMWRGMKAYMYRVVR
ncbi:MAG: ribosomal-protein-alanine N-acetyltransferase [Parvicellaceae bacterium]|jgi:ribosomal-protein-alanine N-acetyltransferase